MKKFKLGPLLICLVVGLQMLTCSVLAADTEPDISVTQGCSTIDAAFPLLGSGQLVDNCSAAVMYEVNADTLLYAWNADAPVYPASLVKIMTALIAVEKGNIADVISVEQEVLDTVPSDAVSCDLVADEILTLHDLLYCMMVSSANDAAAVIANHIGGDQESFVEAMNQRAAEMGCTGTVFKNVHGLHDDEQVTTARDVARILRYAMENEQFREYFTAVNYTVPATNKSEARELLTGNYLTSTENKDEIQIYYDDRVTGGRTGTTEDKNRCIATTASQGDMDIICVTMGSSSVYRPDGYTISVYGGYKETSALLDHGFTDLSISQVLYENQALKQYDVLNGDSVVVAAPAKATTSVLPSGISAAQLSYRYSNTKGTLQAPISKGDIIGEVEVWYNSLCVAKTDLLALNSVAHVQNRVMEQAPVSADAQILLWIIAAVVVGVVIILVIFSAMRSLNKKKAERTVRKRRNTKRRRGY